MSPRRLREKDAKVEGRDPPETAKKTMEPFLNLAKRLLNVAPDEVKKQQQIYEKHKPIAALRKKPKKISHPSSTDLQDSPTHKAE